MSTGSSPHQPSSAQSQTIFRKFWKLAEEGESFQGQMLCTLEENPWLVFERKPKNALEFKNEPFLTAAIHHNRKDLVDLGLRLNAPLEDRNAVGQTSLFCMVASSSMPWKDDKWTYVERMIEAGARCDTVDNKGTPLWLAMGADGPPEWLDRFVKGGAPLNALLEDGTPALSTIIMRSFHAEAARLSTQALVLQGADVNLCSSHQMHLAPIAFAFLDHTHAMADFLLDHGADIHRTDSLGRNFLHLADNDVMAKWLHRQGVDMDAVDRLGRTPLLAVLAEPLDKSSLSEKQKVAMTMVLAGANLDARDHQSTSLSPRDLIRKNPEKFPELSSLLAAMEARAFAHRLLDDMNGPSP